MFRGQPLFLRFNSILGHHTLSNAPAISKRSDIAYLPLVCCTCFRRSTIASSVDFPGLNPYCLGDESSCRCIISVTLFAIDFSSTFPKQMGVRWAGMILCLSCLYLLLLVARVLSLGSIVGGIYVASDSCLQVL